MGSNFFCENSYLIWVFGYAYDAQKYCYNVKQIVPTTAVGVNHNERNEVSEDFLCADVAW